VESPHILAGSFRADENGCRVSRCKGGKGRGGEEARTRGLKKRGDGEKRVGQGRIRGGPKGDREGKAGKVKVPAGCGGEKGSVGKSEWHGWECERAHEVGEGREDRLPKEDMRGAGVGQDG
jgi:hypothetical protein